MIDEKEMVLLATALGKTVRKGVKFSENIPIIYEKYAESKFRYKRAEQVEIIRTMPYLSNLERTMRAWERQVGYCDELALIAFYLSKCVKIHFQEKVYFSILRIFKKHIFCVLHQSENLHHRIIIDNKLIADDFYELDKLFPPNSVICDPWINKSTEISQLILGHRPFIDDYLVPSFYVGPIVTSGFSTEVGVQNIQEIPEAMQHVMRSILICFENYYYGKLPSKNLDINYGKPRVKVQEKLSLCMTLEKLRKFVSGLKKRASSFFEFFEENTKTIHLQQTLEYLDTQIKNQNYLKNERLQQILFIVLRISVLIREESAPIFFDVSMLAISQMGEALMGILLDPNSAIVLKELEKLGIESTRNAMLSGGASIRHRHFALCRYLHTQNIADFLQQTHPSLYRLQQFNIANHHFHPDSALVFLYFPQYMQYCYQQLTDAITA